MSDHRNFENEEENDLIELTDEDGVTSTFEILAQFPFKGEDFLAVSNPIDENRDPDEDLEVLLLQVQDDEEGNEILVVPEDALYDEAFDYFMELVESDEVEFSDPADEEE